jgi:hypothetical protein
MRIVALTGLPRSGKDTAAEWFTLRGYDRLSFADPLKRAAAILLDRPLEQMQGADGFDREAIMPEWGFSTRHFLQVFGTECLRQQVDANFWVKRARNHILNRPCVPFIITDCRFENEAEMVRAHGGIVIEIRRPGIVGSGHVSDAGVAADEVVFNDETVEILHDRIGRVMLAHHAQTQSGPARAFK